MKHDNIGLGFDQIKEISGTNPLLLKGLAVTDTFNDYKQKVEIEVRKFLLDNLTIGGADNTSLHVFLEKRFLENSKKYIYYAYRGNDLTDTECHRYSETWLNQHQVAEIVVLERDEKTLKFNFPTAGATLMDMIRNYLTTEASNILELRSRNRYVAGFMFEAVFLDYCRNNHDLLLSCIYLNAEKGEGPTTMRFSIQAVTFFQDRLNRGDLYELWYQHAVIDFVGCLKHSDNDLYALVMIQLSLQKYTVHKKLSELFTQPPPKSHVPECMEKTGLTLFSYYLQLANLHKEKEIEVIFIYISPEEQNISELLCQLQDDLKGYGNKLPKLLKLRVCVGTLHRESEFYPNMVTY